MSPDPRAKLHPQAREVVEEQYAVGAVPRDILTPEQARAAWQRLPIAKGGPVAEAYERPVNGRGGKVMTRVYRPFEEALGTLLYLHGGGWVTGTLDGSDAVCRNLSVLASCNVVSLAYRLAPEFPFPAALEDTWDCLTSLAEENLLERPAGPIAVAGFSAGGNLAAVVTLMAREQGRPQITYQLLVVPVLDCDFERQSYFDNEADLGLERGEMQWFWNHYLPEPDERLDWRASPLRAADLSGLPPASIVVAECDPLRDEGVEYARRLRAAGVDVVCTEWFGANHGFFGNERIDAGAMAIRAEAEGLRRAFYRAASKAATGDAATGAHTQPA